MLHLKQTLHKCSTLSSQIISETKTGLQSLGLVPQNLQLAESFGQTLSSLRWLIVIAVYLVATFISNLLWLTGMILKKSVELSKSIVAPGSSVLYILCRSVDAVKNTISTFRKWLTSVWKKDGDSVPVSTSASSEMPGEPSFSQARKYYKNSQHEEAMNAPIDIDKIRKSGY